MNKYQPEVITITEAQNIALTHVLSRWQCLPDQICCEAFYEDTLVVLIGGMLIGIEPDGYAHS